MTRATRPRSRLPKPNKSSVKGTGDKGILWNLEAYYEETIAKANKKGKRK